MGRLIPALAFGLLTLSPWVPRPLHGQDTASEARDRFGVSAGVLWYDPPDRQCGLDTPGLSVGVEARARGAWLLAGKAELLFGGVGVCTLALETTVWRGQRVEVDPSPTLGLAPRVSVRGGRAIRIGGWTVTPGVGLGLVHLRTDFRSDEGGFWSPWYGAFARVEGPALPVSVNLEYGSLAFPVRYYGGEDASEIVHEFSRRTPLFRVAVMF